MLGKLAYRNTKRNIKDYLIYLITVTASFSLIFAFNLVANSDEIVKLCSSMDAFKNSLFAVNILIIFVICFLINYTTKFMFEKRSKELLNDINICFLFAQNYHLAMKYVAPLRKELGIRTVFNILGPLTNPAGATYQVMGVYDESLVEPLAQVLSNLGVKRAMVVYGRDGLDEISASNETFVCEINENQFKTYTISPEQFGLQRCLKDELVGGTPKENAQITRDVLNGKQGGSRTAVLMNAGAGLYIGGKVDSLQAGIDLAAELIDSGKANEKLEEFIKESNK